MLFVSIRSASAAQVPKVLRVVEETKRLRHKSGESLYLPSRPPSHLRAPACRVVHSALTFGGPGVAGIAEDEELHQYVIYETEQQRKGPKRINLDDPDPRKGATKYAPPTSLTVHLSKIDMPELHPRATPARRASVSTSPTAIQPPFASLSLSAPVPELSEKERKRIEKERKKAEKEGKKKKGKDVAPPPGPPPHLPPANIRTGSLPPANVRPGSLPPANVRPGSLSPPGDPSTKLSKRPHTPSHQLHPYPPSPSPSQLGNPAIYAAPPPPGPHPPTISMPQARPRPTSMAFPTPVPPGANAFYGPGVGGAGYQPGYPQAPPFPQIDEARPGGRPSSYAPPPGKGPVSSLLEMWAKH